MLDWFAGQFAWLGDEGGDLFWDAIDWVADLGMYGYVLGAAAALVLIWYCTRQP